MDKESKAGGSMGCVRSYQEFGIIVVSTVKTDLWELQLKGWGSGNIVSERP